MIRDDDAAKTNHHFYSNDCIHINNTIAVQCEP